MPVPTLLAVPNISEGRDSATIDAIAQAFASAAPDSVRLLDVHSDADHHRSVFTLAGPQGALADALMAGFTVAIDLVDVLARAGGDGQHPHVGAVDVAPIVYVDPSDRGAACAEALTLADRVGHELNVPVLIYGELSAGERIPPRTRAELRRGGLEQLARRLSATGPGTLVPDFGPPQVHPTAGATLVAARPPLVAFNLQLEPPATLDDARAIAARIREGGEEGLPGLRAIAVELEGEVAQVSMNVERPLELSLAAVLAAVSRHAAVASAELVGLAPIDALRDFPEEVPIVGLDPQRHLIENAIGS